MAAHYLTFKRTYLETIFAVRIYPADLEDIEIAATEGLTGVAVVDKWHRDLIGTRDAFTSLVSRLCKAIRRGEDRIRRIEKSQLKYRLERLSRLCEGDIGSAARHGCHKALKSSPDGQIDPNPHAEIGGRAHSKFCTRNQEHGHDWKDWFEAEHEVRADRAAR